jgi:hypothetical protein
MDLRETGTGVDEESHWYFQAKQIPLLRYFSRCSETMSGKLSILDVGAGSGFFSHGLLTKFNDLIDSVTLVDTGYDADGVSTDHGHNIIRTRSLPDRISASFILLMDVLEHIEDDAYFLADVRKRGQGLNYFFATVPAFTSLWSGHDEFLGHRRRYTRSSLSAVLEAKGFSVNRTYYLYASIFPVVYLVRRLRRESARSGSDLKPASAAVNSLLKVVLGLEHRMAPLNRFFGLTCVAEGVMTC